MKSIKPALVLSLGVTFTVFAVLHLTSVLGLVTDPRSSEIANRKVICEQLAIHCSLAAERGSSLAIEQTVNAVCAREKAILSGAVRLADESLLVEVGDHTGNWKSTDDKLSTVEEVRVPIFVGKKPWGWVELRFTPLDSGGLSAVLGAIVPPYISLSGTFVFLLTFLYLKRVFSRRGKAASEIPERVRATLDALVEGVLVLDKNKNIALANQAFAKTVGQTPSELEGLKADDLAWSKSKDEAGSDQLPWESALADGNIHSGRLLEMETHDGLHRKFSVNSTTICDDGGECRGVLATFHDLTNAEKRNEKLKTLLIELKQSREKIRKHNDQLQDLASMDSLTACLNRRSFVEQFDSHWAARIRYGSPLSCIMLDVDHFKRVNDNHGHQTGDEVLKTLAAILRSSLRNSDLICRYGGEEFCILLPQTNFEGAVLLAERMRASIADKKIENISVTASLGVSAAKFGANSPHELIDQADRALYAAKNNGRNRVIRFDQSSEFPDVVVDNSKPPHDREAEDDNFVRPIPFPAVASLITALAHRDAATAAHSRRVADLCVSVAHGLMSESECYVLEIAALLHDIGKLGVPDAILLKPGPLTEDEWKIMTTHDEMGVDIIRSAFNSLELNDIVATHHAFFEGNPRMPELPSGNDIPLASRILSIADAFDAIVSDRVYRKGRSRDVAFAELRRCAPAQFDPELVERFIEIIEPHEQSNDAALQNVSKQTALKIGLQIERLASALDDNDIPTLRTMAACLGATAVENRIPRMAEVATWLEQAAGADQDVFDIAALTVELLELCRSTQHSYLVNVSEEQHPPTYSEESRKIESDAEMEVELSV